MEPDWNELAGELRSALAARNWREAGAVVWRLRQLDQERYTLELEHYTNQQMGKGGRGVALETEQRLEAVRQWAREMVEDETERELLVLLASRDTFHPRDTTNEFFEFINADRQAVLDWEVTFANDGRHLRLRSDMRDIIWSVLQEQSASDNQDS